MRYHQELRPRDISPAVHELVSPAEKEGAMGSQRINTHIKALAWSKMDSPDPVKWYFDPWQWILRTTVEKDDFVETIQPLLS